MESDEVNSIDDTVESQQVANIIRSTYLFMMSNKTWDHLRRMGQFDSAADLNRPNYLKAPEDLKETVFFNYNATKLNDTNIIFKEVQYKYPDQFLRILSGRNTSNTNTQVVTDFSGITLFVRNDQSPTYWTSFDDRYIVCDSYDKMVDSVLQSSKTQVYGEFDAKWVHLDNAIPDLPSEVFPTLVEDAKSTAMLKIKQMADQKAEQRVRKGNQWLSRRKWALHGGVRYPNYGRGNRK